MTDPFSIEEAILHGDDCPKYTARDMQQAVAAERERWAAIAKSHMDLNAIMGAKEKARTAASILAEGLNSNHRPTGASPV